MVKLTKVGGFIINVMREADRRDCAFYKNHFDALVQRLVDENRVELVFSHINAGYAAGDDKSSKSRKERISNRDTGPEMLPRMRWRIAEEEEER